MSLVNPVFNVQSPDAILMAYGNNPQKIGEAVQQGLIDVTSASIALTKAQHVAASQQQMPQQTVAQKLFNPQQPQMPPQGMPAPGGLGATPQAAAMPPMPQMGAPETPTAPPMDGGAPAMGMADGGMVGPYAGGLSDLPVPDTMFDEPSNGGYANGGLVAFAAGDAVPPAKPAGKYGLGSTLEEQMALLRQYAPQQDKYGKQLNAVYEEELDPEKMKARRSQDMWYALAQGAKAMLETPGSFLTGLGAGVSATGEQAMESKKQRRADKLEAVKTLAAQEGVSNKQAMDAFNVAGELQKAYGGFMDNEEERNLRERMNKLDNETRLLAERISGGYQLGAARISAGASERATTRAEQAEYNQAVRLAWQTATDQVQNEREYRNSKDPAFRDAYLEKKFKTHLQKILGGGGAPASDTKPWQQNYGG